MFLFIVYPSMKGCQEGYPKILQIVHDIKHKSNDMSMIRKSLNLVRSTCSEVETAKNRPTEA